MEKIALPPPSMYFTTDDCADDSSLNLLNLIKDIFKCNTCTRMSLEVYKLDNEFYCHACKEKL